MARSLNDVIHGDRAAIRGYTVAKKTDDWYDPNDLFQKSKSWGSTTKTTNVAPSCYESHPPLKLPGTELVIFGGSCCHPKVKDADIYIGFDSGMELTSRRFPWNAGDEILYRVPDMGVPANPVEYAKLVAWTICQLDEGKKIHCGCIGGHGRTGMFLAALVSKFGEKDATSYVREHYCKKVVESQAQVEFLAKHFGVKPVGGFKSYSPGKTDTVKSSGSKMPSVAEFATTETFRPVGGAGCIWG